MTHPLPLNKLYWLLCDCKLSSHCWQNHGNHLASVITITSTSSFIIIPLAVFTPWVFYMTHLHMHNLAYYLRKHQVIDEYLDVIYINRWLSRTTHNWISNVSYFETIKWKRNREILWMTRRKNQHHQKWNKKEIVYSIYSCWFNMTTSLITNNDRNDITNTMY